MGEFIMKLADTHVHLENIEYGRVEGFFDELYKNGVTDATILALCSFHNYHTAQNLIALSWKERYKKINLRAFGSFHETDFYRDVPYEKQLLKMLSLGIDGVKFIQMKPDARKNNGKGVNHPAYDRAFSIMEERGTPVLIHSGDPENLWNKGEEYDDPSFLHFEEIYNEDFEMLDKHPRLNVTFAHFFFLSNQPDRVEKIFDKYPNVKFDLTPGWEMFIGFSKDIKRWQGIFDTYSDRILYGTDSNTRKNFNTAIRDLVVGALTHDETEFQMPCYGGHTIRGLDLSEKTFNKIFYENYLNFVGKSPAPVNKSGLIESAERMLSDLKNVKGEEKSVSWLFDFLKREKQI